MTKPCLFCGVPLMDDVDAWACFNPNCVQNNTGIPKKLYEKFEKLSNFIKSMKLTQKEQNDYFVRLFMSAIYKDLEDIAFWKDEE
jgi:hypothetical protein